jgi:mannonate dehydratase
MFKFIGGSYFQTIKPFTALSIPAQELITNSIIGLTEVIDNHAHLCGVGGQHDEFYINNCFHTTTNFAKRLHYAIFANAAGITSTAAAPSDTLKNTQYLSRLEALLDNINNIIPYRIALLPMDYYHETDGTINKQKTAFYCSSKSVADVAHTNTTRFIPIVSIHPAKSTAITELEEAHAHGITVIKWLPNSMNINCSCEDYALGGIVGRSPQFPLDPHDNDNK